VDGAETPENMTVLRGYTLGGTKPKGQAAIALLNQKIANPDTELAFKSRGFLSCTASGKIANGYADTISLSDFAEGSRGVKFEIQVPKGTAMIPISFSSDHYSDEMEFLMDRNTNITIDKVSMPEGSHTFLVYGHVDNG
jgi:hypothetical protein